MATRWVCPECGKGVNGPQRPRKTATVRFCLSCSAGSDLLVERTAPALERKRAQRTAERLSKAAEAKIKERERERDKLTTPCGQYVPEVVARILKLDEISINYTPALEVRRRKDWGNAGRAFYHRRLVSLSFGTGIRYPEFETLLILHEVMHLEMHHRTRGGKTDRAGRYRHHGPEFKASLYRAAKELWPEIDFTPAWRFVETRRAYDIDRALERCLRGDQERLTKWAK